MFGNPMRVSRPADSLEMTFGKGIDPDIRPGGRDGQRANAIQSFRIAERGAKPLFRLPPKVQIAIQLPAFIEDKSKFPTSDILGTDIGGRNENSDGNASISTGKGGGGLHHPLGAWSPGFCITGHIPSARVHIKRVHVKIRRCRFDRDSDHLGILLGADSIFRG